MQFLFDLYKYLKKHLFQIKIGLNISTHNLSNTELMIILINVKKINKTLIKNL